MIAVDVSADRLTRLTEEVAGDTTPIVADITDPASTAQILEAAGPRIDGLANVAGIMDGFEPTAEIALVVQGRAFELCPLHVESERHSHVFALPWGAGVVHEHGLVGARFPAELMPAL